MSTGKKVKRKLRGWALRGLPLMITCKELESFIVDYIDQSLPQVQRRKFELHLQVCSSCKAYIQDYTQSIALSQAAFDETDDDACDNMPEDLIAAILDSRKNLS